MGTTGVQVRSLPVRDQYLAKAFYVDVPGFFDDPDGNGLVPQETIPQEMTGT